MFLNLSTVPPPTPPTRAGRVTPHPAHSAWMMSPENRLVLQHFLVFQVSSVKHIFRIYSARVQKLQIKQSKSELTAKMDVAPSPGCPNGRELEGPVEAYWRPSHVFWKFHPGGDLKGSRNFPNEGRARGGEEQCRGTGETRRNSSGSGGQRLSLSFGGGPHGPSP